MRSIPLDLICVRYVYLLIQPLSLYVLQYVFMPCTSLRHIVALYQYKTRPKSIRPKMISPPLAEVPVLISHGRGGSLYARRRFPWWKDEW